MQHSRNSSTTTARLVSLAIASRGWQACGADRKWPTKETVRVASGGAGARTAGRLPRLRRGGTRATRPPLARSRRQPLLERLVHAGLPTRSACAKCAQDFAIQPDRNLFLLRLLPGSTEPANNLDRRSDATARCDDALVPFDASRTPRRTGRGRFRSSNLGGTKYARSRFRLACGRHNDRKSK